MKLILISFLLLSANIFSQEFSMRRCMILPVTDNLGGAVGFKVFEKLESHIKDSRWCYYKSNSQILGILQNYRSDLHNHLKNPDVLRTLANKVKSGSLIKTHVEHSSKSTIVKMEVIGDNGSDLYFKETTSLNNADPDVVSATIINWLEIYSRSIPYDGLVTGILGTQFTIDVGKASQVRIGDEVDIIRPTKRRRHPLLKEIVDWDFELLSHGKIFNVSEFQAQGNITDVVKKKNVRVGDWVRRNVRKKVKTNFEEKYDKVKKEEFGKLGQVAFHAEVGKGSGKNVQTGVTKAAGGLNLGVSISGELWATRNYFLGAGFGRRFGKYSATKGNFTQDETSATSGYGKVFVGYKYLPMGFFYGPQVDGYIGYGSNTYDMDLPSTEGFVEVNFKGLFVGARGDMPVKRDIRVYTRLEWMPSPGFKETERFYGDAESKTGFMFQIGGVYQYAPNLHVDGALELMTNKAKFANADQLSFNSAMLRVGAVFTY